MFKLTPEFNHACMPPPSTPCIAVGLFELFQPRSVGGRLRPVAPIVLHSFCACKFENLKGYLLGRKKYFAQIFERVLSEEWAGLQR